MNCCKTDNNFTLKLCLANHTTYLLNKYKPGVSSCFPHLEISWLLVERWEGKDLRTQVERSSGMDPELAEMLEARNGIFPMEKVNSRTFEMSYQVFCQAMDCITTWKWKRAVRWCVSKGHYVSLGGTLLGVSVWAGCLRLLLRWEDEKIAFISANPTLWVRKDGKRSGSSGLVSASYSAVTPLTMVTLHCVSSSRVFRSTHSLQNWDATQEPGHEAEPGCPVSQLGPLAAKLLWME